MKLEVTAKIAQGKINIILAACHKKVISNDSGPPLISLPTCLMITWFSSHLLSDRTDTVSGNRPLSLRKHKMTSLRFKISTHLCRLHIYNPSLYAGRYLHNTTAVLSIFHKLLQLRFARSRTSCQSIWNQTVLDLQRKSITWQRPPVSSFLLSWQRQPSSLTSCPLVIAH